MSSNGSHGIQKISGISEQKARVLALIFIPADASLKEAGGWLLSQCPYLSREDRSTICRLHMEDPILRQWRIREADVSRS